MVIVLNSVLDRYSKKVKQSGPKPLPWVFTFAPSILIIAQFGPPVDYIVIGFDVFSCGYTAWCIFLVPFFVVPCDLKNWFKLVFFRACLFLGKAWKNIFSEKDFRSKTLFSTVFVVRIKNFGKRKTYFFVNWRKKKTFSQKLLFLKTIWTENTVPARKLFFEIFLSVSSWNLMRVSAWIFSFLSPGSCSVS